MNYYLNNTYFSYFPSHYYLYECVFFEKTSFGIKRFLRDLIHKLFNGMQHVIYQIRIISF